MKKSVDISVLIVNTNDIAYIKDCLMSLCKQQGHLIIEILVVDNASTDGSAELIKKIFPQVHLIKNEANLFYTRANNKGLKKVRGKNFLILNPDTRLPKATLFQITKFMKKYPRAGLVGCSQINQNGEKLQICHRFYTPLTQMLVLPLFYNLAKNSAQLNKHYYAGWDRTGTRQVDTIPGSFMFGRTELLHTVGLLDESMPMFHSDDDYCLRIKQAGYQIWYVGSITISHFTSKTISRLPPLKVKTQGYRDVVTYFKKHYGPLWGIIFYILTGLSLLVLAISNYFVSINKR